MDGRKPKPIALRRLYGNPGKRPMNDREPKWSEGAVPAPDWLSDRAREVWFRVAPELLKTGVLKPAFEDTLACYCLNVAALIELEGVRALHQGDRRWERRDLATSRDLQSHILRFAVEFGLTPSASSRIIVDVKPEDEFEKFVGRAGRML